MCDHRIREALGSRVRTELVTLYSKVVLSWVGSFVARVYSSPGDTVVSTRLDNCNFKC